MLRTLQRCTVSSIGHQLFPPRVPKPLHEVRIHVPYAIRMVRTRGGPPIPRIIQCCSDRIRPVRNDHETLLGSDVSSQVRQEEGPRLGHLRLNKCKHNRQDVVIPILRHCNQQNPAVFPIQVGPVNGNEILAVLECFDARGKRPEDFVELSRSMVQSVPVVIRHRFKVCHHARRNTIGTAERNHSPITKVLPQGNSNAPRASILRVLAPKMVLGSVRLNNPILCIPPDAIILNSSLNRFPITHPMADSDLCPPSVL
ncbi:hypothetical protein PIB30_061946 [Stylosanthes scabra]|uniref:Uncharacterized protein n=1 Tax=Stylosanthes scabra TaxID=79078 RepID=A0ABU6WKW3_9FABA|nr:hypothetical protein [Stylosanthes scabra]